MSDVKKIPEPGRAWLFLKRNPAYVEDRESEGAVSAPREPAAFAIRARTEADGKAASWGLLAWEDPFDEAGPVSPFWGGRADAGGGAGAVGASADGSA